MEFIMKYKKISNTILVLLLLSLMSCGRDDNKEEIALNDEPTAAATKIVPVEVMIASKHDLEATIPFTGVLAPIGSVDIISEVAGKVKKINKKLGQSVSNEDILELIDEEVPFHQFQQAQAKAKTA